MTVKLAILKSGENIISDIKEGFLGEKLICHILENPCSIEINGSYRIIGEEDDGDRVSIFLKRWPSLSKQNIVELVPDWIVTIVEPNDDLKKMYEEQVLGINKNETNQSNSVDQQSNSNQSD